MGKKRKSSEQTQVWSWVAQQSASFNKIRRKIVRPFVRTGKIKKLKFTARYRRPAELYPSTRRKSAFSLKGFIEK